MIGKLIARYSKRHNLRVKIFLEEVKFDNHSMLYLQKKNYHFQQFKSSLIFYDDAVV